MLRTSRSQALRATMVALVATGSARRARDNDTSPRHMSNPLRPDIRPPSADLHGGRGSLACGSPRGSTIGAMLGSKSARSRRSRGPVWCLVAVPRQFRGRLSRGLHRLCGGARSGSRAADFLGLAIRRREMCGGAPVFDVLCSPRVACGSSVLFRSRAQSTRYLIDAARARGSGVDCRDRGSPCAMPRQLGRHPWWVFVFAAALANRPRPVCLLWACRGTRRVFTVG